MIHRADRFCTRMKYVKGGCSFLIVLVSVITSGCFHSPKPVFNSEMTPAEISLSLEHTVSSIKTFSASGVISVESPSLSQNVGFTLTSRGQDSVRIILEGPFGIRAGAGLFSRNSFKVYSALNNTLYQGSSQKQLAGFPIINNVPIGVLISALNGIQFFSSSAEPDSFLFNNGLYRFVYLQNTGVKDIYEFDGFSQRILRYDRFDANGKAVWNLRYQYTKNDTTQQIPKITAIRIPSKDISITIEFGEAQYNAAVPAYSIETPDDAETVTIK